MSTPLRTDPDRAAPAGARASAAAARPAELLFFWDYDTQWGWDRSRRGDRPASWGHLEFEYTDRLLELHGEYEVKACFAAVGAAAQQGERPYHDPAQIRRIHAAGHEVASHSFRHEWLPGLSLEELRETVTASRDALEQCIGASVRAFVPPFNQPFDYPRGFSFSLSERREAGAVRNDLPALCRVLGESGYRFCRVSYRSIWMRAAERLLKRRADEPGKVEDIAGILCARLNTPCGFGPSTGALLERCVARGGLAVVYGHPHALGNADFQAETSLVPFLRRVRELRRQGRLHVRVPRELETAA